MKALVVTDQGQKWFEISDANVLTARRYLAEPESGSEGTSRVLNLCRTGRYQGRGYYVSLVAEARGQRPLPDVKTVEDLRSDAYVRTLDEEMQPLVQESLQHQAALDIQDMRRARTAPRAEPGRRHRRKSYSTRVVRTAERGGAR